MMNRVFSAAARMSVSILVAVGLLCVFAVFMSRHIKKNTPVKFGATYMTMNNPYFQAMDEHIKQLVTDYGDVLISRDPAQSQDRQNDQIIDMLEEGISVLFLNPVDRTRTQLALDACNAVGVPIFIIDTEVEDMSSVVSCIQSNNYLAGAQCAEDMISKMPSGADILVLYDTRISSTVLRYEGFIQTIEPYNMYNIVDIIYNVSEIEVATEKLNAFLDRDVAFDVIFANNDPTALGCIAALQQNNRDIDKILIYGVDGSPDVKAMIRKDVMTGTAAQYPLRMATLAVEMAYRYLNGKDVDKHIVIDTELITYENVFLYDVDGWQ